MFGVEVSVVLAKSIQNPEAGTRQLATRAAVQTAQLAIH